MKVVNYTESEDQDIRCATCGRMVKRAVALSDRPGFHGLDCAARLLGKPRSRKAMDDIEIAGMKARAEGLGVLFGERARARFGVLPSKGTFKVDGVFSYKAYTEYVRSALMAVGGPLPEDVGSFRDAYWSAFIDTFGGR